EGGKRLPIEPAPVDVEALLSETHELFKAQAATSSITLQYRVADGVPPVYADHHRVLQVLSNLIGNAVKFTPAGGVVSYTGEPRVRRDEVLLHAADLRHIRGGISSASLTLSSAKSRISRRPSSSDAS